MLKYEARTTPREITSATAKGIMDMLRTDRNLESIDPFEVELTLDFDAVVDLDLDGLTDPVLVDWVADSGVSEALRTASRTFSLATKRTVAKTSSMSEATPALARGSNLFVTLLDPKDASLVSSWAAARYSEPPRAEEPAGAAARGVLRVTAICVSYRSK